MLTVAIEQGIARLTLNRPQVGNAFNAELIAELQQQFERLADDDTVRALVLAGEGKHFCAGADLNWMKQQKDGSQQDNQADALALAQMLKTLNDFPKPTIAMVQGAAFGGALGLICACDMAVAADNARFCLSEVKLGLSPATISPYVLAAMGPRQARRYWLTAELIDAPTAQQLQLVHRVVAAEDLLDQVQHWCQAVVANGPRALAATKQLIQQQSTELNDALLYSTSDLIARLRVSDEGQEGLTAFLEKRSPAWQITPDKEPAPAEQPTPVEEHKV
ncbi:gamma-carboxygeranoyl-CoA hydratase [Bacterioplanes sanyensis]|uniref:enoyl-CoA hydratase/isomerase family protein n=1 Tax=Bacterioplanes sanyensis TaxID=1249553 RepID=UPI001672C41F|nr:enoyl-CoA hydratase/isomerase family protein [Bacterioplanes sanyensis]GGY57263.1 gamma-carboxygeranoyl-CoA hydratase [Bacterioplanes sanyensis]